MALSILHHQMNQYTTASGTQATNDGTAYTPTIGNLLVVVTYQTVVTSGETITDNQGTPNTWTKQGGAADSSDNGLSIWTAPVTQTGSGFTVNFSGMGTVATPGALSIIEITGQNASTPIDGTPNVNNNSNTAGTAVSVNVGTASQTGDLALLAVCVNTAVTVTWGGTLSQLDGDNTLASPGWIGSGTISGTGSTTLTATLNQSTRMAQGGIIISPAASTPYARLAYPVYTRFFT